MLGDTAVMVHPEDERYKHLIGRQVKLPITGRLVPVIADEYVDKEFGTGVVKVTPAHDTNDYQVGQRHQLPMLTIFTLDATVVDTMDAIPGRVPRPGPLRRAQADRQGARGPRPAGRGQEAQADGAALRPAPARSSSRC